MADKDIGNEVASHRPIVRGGLRWYEPISFVNCTRITDSCAVNTYISLDDMTKVPHLVEEKV